ncbi:metal ABC transporter substrate-binding protein [Nisaea acidiphila]|uniref:Metal ABC transporter substrate-binding protein n=1 Tax=Nisaea acidiphila TaxID=1862145 RepID=A0A9J7AN85_9PROT|nr:metal ABC transporter substrate-binding protein [Nisaea acidiphila]UUX48904.1 metal ABC transporter substrate-binding protein [Nisaea acidiphila]
MFNRRTILCTAFVAAGLALAPAAQAAEPAKKVVASFSILGDIVKNLGGDRIEVVTLVGPNGDAHVYQPTPKDARSVSEADLVIVNGLGFEGWLDRLVEAAEYKGTVAVATAGIEALKSDEDHDSEHDKDHDKDHASEESHEHKAEAGHEEGHDHHHHHGEFDPHAWQSVANARVYVENLRKALTDIDPSGAETYAANAKSYLTKLGKLDAEIRSTVASLPVERRKVVTSHDAFGYFGHEYNIEFLAPVGMSTESEASAADVAHLIRQIKEEKIPAIFVENITDRRLLDQIARETGAVVGGTLFSDALSGPEGPAGTYVEMMQHNIRTLATALSSS